ncbi:hypothetical protein [Pediococcus claussenii]|uniref:Uncharacterized protein n=1 Tax=Pediococcus claussenii (strain ATCC BAA-344 / DSM 14800 / JCM 18046 / KCTC 3811 / LMG 21948 / P06) TaxID=701521 RepID=G8PCY8_PEDCP|nr:hypothetical protein [Pediococcus claussenii]AEV95123.1 hypothetical protein PECL_850 [Pediococcus claussenii ATCC BAA-344]ANZ70309.1 hypothetical protein AYR57_08260 [Pediococcus claussenii]ANZ72125.1 hypothetical protein AYR58_08260 [Pediococcus claussenii]KRN18882.1 hypothetical protein IV79_GL000308 [Pediococcus claussenii]
MDKEDYSLNKVEQEIRAGHNDTALSILEVMDNRSFDKDVLFLLIRVYLQVNKANQALRRIKEQENIFLSDKDGLILYLDALILDRNFIKARTMLRFVSSKSLHEKKLSEILNAESLFINEFPKTIREYEKDFYHLGECSLVEQNKAIENANHLPASSYVKSAKFLFLDPYLNQMVRTTVLQKIVGAGLQIQAKFLWINEETVLIDTDRIQPLENSKYFVECSKIIKNVTGEQGLENLRMEQLRIFLSLVFPFPEKFIKSPSEFVNGLIEHSEHGIENRFTTLDHILIQLQMGLN